MKYSSMLFCFIFFNRFIVLIQSGFYLDFFLKKCCEVFIKNIFIYTSHFFGEKYFIEVLTKKIIDSCVFFIGKYTYITNLSFTTFFLIITFLFFYSYITFIIFYFSC